MSYLFSRKSYLEIKRIQHRSTQPDPVKMSKLLNKEGKHTSSGASPCYLSVLPGVGSLQLCFGALQLDLSSMLEQSLDMVHAMDPFQKAVTDKHGRLSFLHATESPSIFPCDFTQSNTSLHLHIPPQDKPHSTELQNRPVLISDDLN